MIQAVVFLTSCSILCYEIILTRIFAITQWQNMASLVISIALLGFGAGGTAITLLKKTIDRRFDEILLSLLILYPTALCAGFIIYCRIPFNPFEIGSDRFQILAIMLDFAVLGVPFFFGASIIGIILTRFPISRTYFSDLAGSGVGAIVIIILSHLFHPFTVLVIITALAFLGGIIFSLGKRRSMIFLASSSALIVTLGFSLSIELLHLKSVSPYKALSKTLTLPDARILDERYSPLGLVQVAEAGGLRSAPGLSFRSPFDIPVQKGIFFDADSMSPITPFTGDAESIRYLDYVPSSLPYHMLERDELKHVLIIGAGGGEGILKAILNEAKSITAVELNRDVIELMKGKYSGFSGGIFNRPEVKIVNREARGFIRSGKNSYDLVEISMLDTLAASSSGIYALNENYLYTVESVKEILQRLDDNGLLAITRWNSSPPRDIFKMLNICIDALDSEKIEDRGSHIFLMRTILTYTIILSKSPLSTDMIEKGRQFCNDRLFDILFYEGMSPRETNRFIRLKTPEYYETALSLLSPQRESAINEFRFEIRAPRDNSPYFYNFFKPATLDYLLSRGKKEIPFTEWGYLALVIFLVPAFFVSLLLILLPLLLLKKQVKASSLSSLSFFSLVAIGFFFVEMPMIQKLILFLSHPSYSLSVIVSTLLISSGAGSFFSDRIFEKKRRILCAATAVSLILLSYLLCLDPLLGAFIQYPDVVKILVTILIIAPAGFFMGIPFPQGLSLVKEYDESQVPWAWGVNGFFSVISILLASLFAVIYGFKTVFFLAALCYVSAGILSLNLNPHSR